MKRTFKTTKQSASKPRRLHIPPSAHEESSGANPYALAALLRRSGNELKSELARSEARNSDISEKFVNKEDWRELLDAGLYNGSPIYIHYTNSQGLAAIISDQSINDQKREERRADSKRGIYVNPPGQQLSPENVENLLFLGNERYKGNGDYMVVFSSNQSPSYRAPVTHGSSFEELKMDKAIALNQSNILYWGENIFSDCFD